MAWQFHPKGRNSEIMTEHIFGGDWTNEKLELIRKYLCAYTTIFNQNERAKYFTTIYVDAFAGTGRRVMASRRLKRETGQAAIFDDAGDLETDAVLKGSVRIALEVDPPFNQYVFIEKSKKRAKELASLLREFPAKAKAVQIEQADANAYLKQWCAQMNWRRHRAVVFLDPYGMQVEWATIEAIAKTKAIDLWILFPLGVAVNRLLTREQSPPKRWGEQLTRLFGTDEWKKTFYVKHQSHTLFGDVESERKEANFDRIGNFFLKRLKTVFAEVASNPRVLKNSKGVPIYWLCFAAGNPKGAKTAVKIAQDILLKQL